MTQDFTVTKLASFPALEQSEEAPGTDCSRMREVSLVTCVVRTVRYTNHAIIEQSISLYLLISYTVEICPLWHTFGGFEVKMLSLSKERITSFTCHSVYLEWPNRRIIFASEELSVFIPSSFSFRRSMVNGSHLSRRRNRLTNRG